MPGPFDPLSSDAFANLFGGMTHDQLFQAAQTKKGQERDALAKELFRLAAEGRALAERWGAIAERRRQERA